MAEEQPQASSETDAVGKDPADQRMVQLARVLMVTKQQVEKLAESVTELSSKHQHIDDLSASLTGRLTDLNTTLGETGLAGRTGDGQDQLAARIDGLQKDLATAIKGIESIGSGAERASSKLDEQIFALKGRVTAFADGVEHWFKPAQSEIEANKQYVEQATEQIRQQLYGFENAARTLQDRIDGGLADLRQRHEMRDDSIAQLSTQLDTKLAACLDVLTTLPQRMSELITLVKDSCVGPADLDGHARAMQAQIDAAVVRLDEQIGPGLAHLSTRFDTSDATRTEIRDNCRAVQQQLGGAIGQLQDGMSSLSESVAKALSATLEQQLAAFSTRSESVTEQMLQRLTQALSSIETRGQRLEQDAALDRAKLSEGQGQIETALGQLHAQVTQTIAGFDSHRTAADRHLSGITQQLAELRDQLATVGPLMDQKVDPLLVALQKQEQEREATGPMIAKATADLQAGLSRVTEQVDACVSRSLAGIDARSRKAEETSGAQRKELAVGQKELSMAIIRLQGQLSESQAAANDHRARQEQRSEEMAAALTTSLKNLSSQLARPPVASEGTEVLVSVDQQLGELREQLAMVSTQIEGTRTSDGDRSDAQVLAAIEAQQGLRSTADTRLEQDMADLKKQVDAMASQIGTEVSEALANLKTSIPAPAVGAGVAVMADLRAELSTITERVDSRVSQVLAEFEAHKGLAAAGDHAPEQFNAAMDRIEQRLTAAVDELTVPAGEMSRQFEQQFDTLQKGLTELADRIEAIDSRPTGVPDTPRGYHTPAPPPAPSAAPVVTSSVPEEPQRSFSSVLEEVSPEESLDQSDTAGMHDIHHKVADNGQDDDSVVVDHDDPPPTSLDEEHDFSAAGAFDAPPSISVDQDDDYSTAGTLDAPTPMSTDEHDDSGPADLLDIPAVPMEQDTPVPEIQDVTGEPTAEPVVEPAPTDDDAPAEPSQESQPEELIQGLIDAINSGNADVIRKFVTEEYSASALEDGGPDPRVEVYMAVHEEGGECRVVSVDTTADGDLVAVVQSRLSLSRQRLQIVLDQKPPHKILLVTIDEV